MRHDRRRGARLTFGLSSATLAYIYIGYPLAIGLVARRRARPVRRAPILPTVSLVVAAHDEARRLARKLDDCLALDYPRERLEIVVASDGSTDGTVAVAGRYAGAGVRVLAFAPRRGKPSVLNRAIAACQGEIVVLSDVRQTWSRGALRALVENFADPSVGAVSGELSFVRDGATAPADGTSAVGNGVSAYWRYEKAIRRAESAVDSTVGATGAIYAIRRELYEPIPTDTLVDDLLIPLRIARRGYRCVFDGRAIAWDRAAATAGEEFLRKTRTIAGTAQLFARERWLLRPRTNRLWLQAVSHKLLRLASPFALLALAVATARLARSSGVFRGALVAQAAFYGAAVAGTSVPGRLVAFPYAFCLLNLTTVAGLVRFLTGTQAVTWRRAAP
jgi:cellulose synthase/poly-beta-1,6-N-acetylglucosamine synthase-like glycosyltransferase